MSESKKIDLSVVIITKNEEEMIRNCIESVILSVEYAVKKDTISSYEIILSDSASTDKTIEISKEYPITIVQLDKRWPLSAAAGRYIGNLYSNGKYVFFMDGDCIVDQEWIHRSIPYLEEENVAGIDGIEEEFIDPSSPFYNYFPNEPNKEIVEVEVLGKAIFKKSVLDDVGSYNPYLIGAEDRDISYRVKDSGYKLLRLPFVYVTHHWAKKSGKLTLGRYLKSVYVWSRGEGEALRYSIKNKRIAKKYILRYINTFYLGFYGKVLLSLSLVYLNILTVTYFTETLEISFLTFLLDIALLGLGLIYTFIRYKAGKLNEFIFSFHMVPYVFIRHIGFILGLIKFPKDPKKYPTKVKIMKNSKLESLNERDWVA